MPVPGVRYLSGTGMPEGAVAGPPTSVYHDETDNSLWDKYSGYGTTGWRNRNPLYANAVDFGFSTLATASYNSGALQDAMNSLGTSGVLGTGGVVGVPHGDFNCNGGITHPPGVFVEGQGYLQTNLRHPTNDTFISAVGGGTDELQRGWRRLGFTGNSGASAKAALVSDCLRAIFDNVAFFNYAGTNGTAINLYNSGSLTENYTESTLLYKVTTFGCKYSLALGRDASGHASFRDTKLIGCFLDASNVDGAVGIYVGDGCILYGGLLDTNIQVGGQPNTIAVQTAGTGTIVPAFPTAVIGQTQFNVLVESTGTYASKILKMNSTDEISGVGQLTDNRDWEFDASQLVNRPTYDIASGARYRIRGHEEEFIEGESRATPATRLFEQELVSASPASNTYYQLATLPVSTSATRDKLKIEWMWGSYTSDTQMDAWAIFTNRGGFQYTWKQNGLDRVGARDHFRVQAYNNAGVVTLYARASASMYTQARFKGTAAGLGIKNMASLGIGAGTTTVPTGTLVFDSADLTTYPPNAETRAGFMVSNGYGVAAQLAANTSPVTVNANSTTAQNLMSASVPAGYLNVLGRTLRVRGAGVWSTVSTTQVPTITIDLTLGGVVIASWVSLSVTTGGQANVPWTFEALLTTSAIGASGTVEAHGDMRTRTAAAAGPVNTFLDSINAASGAIDLTTAKTLQVRITFSTNTTTPNTATQRQMIALLAG